MKIKHEWNGHLEICSRPQVIENSRQYLFLRADVFQNNRWVPLVKGRTIDGQNGIKCCSGSKLLYGDHQHKLSLSHIPCEFVCDKSFSNVLQIFIQKGLNDFPIVMIIGIHSRIRVR